MQASSYEPLGIGVGTLIANRYEIDRKLGAGGMSAVYLVRDRALNSQLYALKVMDPRLTTNDSDLERFRNEVVITRKLTHPNIVRTFEFGTTPNDLLYVVMEYVQGQTLHQIIHSQTRDDLSLGDIVHILFGIAKGISYAHEMEVMHRDLKPANVLISSAGDIKIADFGLACAKEMQLRLTQAGECVGTPAYMAPEQVQGQNLNYSVDTYALGVVAFELMTGVLPFEAKGWYELASQIVSQPFPRPLLKRTKTPVWLESFILKATEKDPQNRYLTSEEIVNVFENHLTDTSVINTKKKRNTSVQNVAWMEFKDSMLVGTFRYAPLMILASLFVMGYMVISSYGASSASQVTDTVDKSSEAINKFSQSLQKMNAVVAMTYENKDKLDAVFAEIPDKAGQDEKKEKSEDK